MLDAQTSQTGACAKPTPRHGAVNEEEDDPRMRSASRSSAPRLVLGLALAVVLAPSSWHLHFGAEAGVLPSFTGLRRDTAPYKGFSGIRASERTARRVFYHDQTIAVVEVENNVAMKMQNCELVEVKEENVARAALKNLSSIATPIMTSFPEMNGLMRQCHALAPPKSAGELERRTTASRRGNDNPNSALLSGILPGTKWCGTGDIAQNYFDLGAEKDIDRCCRTHDLCPVKVGAFQTRYGLSNMSFYTKSHCACDDMLFKCLKQSNRSTANIMGNIYFNVLRASCVEDVEDNQTYGSVRRYRAPKRY